MVINSRSMYNNTHSLKWSTDKWKYREYVTMILWNFIYVCLISVYHSAVFHKGVAIHSAMIPRRNFGIYIMFTYSESLSFFVLKVRENCLLNIQSCIYIIHTNKIMFFTSLAYQNEGKPLQDSALTFLFCTYHKLYGGVSSRLALKWLTRQEIMNNEPIYKGNITAVCLPFILNGKQCFFLKTL